MQIKPSIVDFSSILSGEETKYNIPKYQRDYSWKYNDEVEELWNDILFSYEQNNEYFIGNIVLNANGDIEKATEFDIVDGQQRITTFSILFKVIRDYIAFFNKNNGQDEIFNSWNYDEHYDTTNKLEKRVSDRLVYYGEPDNYYIKLNEKDNPVFKDEIINNSKLLKNENDFKIISNEHRIIKTKKFLAKKIIEKFILTEEPVDKLNTFINHLIKKLKINSIKVGEDYDAYLLFESLNSKGMSLSQSDLIKNKMLMLCKDEKRELNNVFENWNEIVNNLKSSKNNSVVDFIYYHWLTFESSAVTKKTLYKNVNKKLLTLIPKKVDKFSNELAKKSLSYSYITNRDLSYPSSNIKSKSLQQYLSEISQLKYSICIPAIFYAYHKESTTVDSLAKLSISFLYRTITIGELQVRKAKEAFDEILKYLKSNSNHHKGEIAKIFKDHIEVDDESFKKKFTEKTFSNSIAKYTLTKIMEYELGNETMIHEVDLEHILPQKFKQHWSDFDFKKRKPEDVINNIGNLTLINPRNNKKVQNYEFENKISFFKARKDKNDENSTTIPITFNIYNQYVEDSKRKNFEGNEYWDTDRIDLRAKKLSMNIAKIWEI